MFLDFWEWKNLIERQTSSRFVSRSGFSVYNNIGRRTFVCSRQLQSTTRRSGSSKVKANTSQANIHCPAHIKIERNLKTDSIRVYYNLQHLGHEKELIHIELIQEERDYLTEILTQCSDSDHDNYARRSNESEDSTRWLLCTVCGILVSTPSLFEIQNIVSHLRKSQHQNELKKSGLEVTVQNRVTCLEPVRDRKKFKRINNDVSAYRQKQQRLIELSGGDGGSNEESQESTLSKDCICLDDIEPILIRSQENSHNKESQPDDILNIDSESNSR